MLIIAVILLVAGFIFPVAWLGLLGLGIYLIASRKSRRADAVESRVAAMVAAGRESAKFPELYFEAARSYCVAKGAQATDAAAASTHILVNGVSYSVFFAKMTDGGTAVLIRDLKIASDTEGWRASFEEQLNNVVDTAISGAKVAPRRVTPKAKTARPKPDKTQAAKTIQVGGIRFDGDGASDAAKSQIVDRIVARIQDLSPTQLHAYRYVMEEADRIEKRGVGRYAVASVGVQPIEYAGEMGNVEDYADYRGAITYLDNDVSPDLERLFGADTADMMRANMFLNFYMTNAEMMAEIRKKYAVQFANACAARSHFGMVDQWDEVIRALS